MDTADAAYSAVRVVILFLSTIAASRFVVRAPLLADANFHLVGLVWSFLLFLHIDNAASPPRIRTLYYDPPNSLERPGTPSTPILPALFPLLLYRVPPPPVGPAFFPFHKF